MTKRIFFLLPIAFFVLAFFLVQNLGEKIAATSYQVNALVPYPVPTTASVVDGAFQNKTVNTSSITVTGSCTPLSPYAVVSIVRTGNTIGSALCTPAGFFSIPISLLNGPNTLILRTSNIESVFGPDSNPFIVTYTPEISSNAQPPATTPSASSDGELTISTIDPVIVPTDSNVVSIVIVIGGGSSPYEVTLNWGDGTVEIKKVDKKGSYTFSHTYLKSQNYVVKVTVKDVLGQTTEITIPVASKTPPTPSPSPTPILSKKIGKDGVGQTWYLWSLILLVGVLSYVLGKRRERRILLPAKKRKSKK